MNNIKAGQVYSSTKCNEVIVISLIMAFGSHYRVSFVNNKGRVFDIKVSELSEIVDGYKLIATYPTWQEAINSKEFNNV